MPKKQTTKNSGLGNAIRNKQGRKNAPENRASGRMKRRQNEIKQLEVQNPNSNAPKLRSVTEVTDLQEFVDTIVEAQKYEQVKEEVQLIVKENDVGAQEAKLLAELAKFEVVKNNQQSKKKKLFCVFA
ncbi:hypothetical protein RFI_30198 [Reticulomyxa filosa]|uniref:Uncharacterized protein n=1 Tax=Reticulomyxa filosa TaxID=46433 RepID=X6LZ27_RETFI|nr:hypothetical protein RFI_30198 [Reticulomyxa filosa]|eukprot:ETO07193.1 hypothetical protein RFI_30198 [Reticulomyxa filosa]